MQVPAILRGKSLKRPLQGAAAALVSACSTLLLTPKSAAFQ